MSINLLVLADPGAAWLQSLKSLSSTISITITSEAPEIRAVAPDADVILNAAPSPQLLSAALEFTARLQWMHSLWTGVDAVLSPEVLASPAPLTNGRGIFRIPLAEWTLASMLHFSYRIRRLIRQQEEGIWEPFTTEVLQGRTLGIVGYGGIGRAGAERAHAFGMRILAMRRRPELFALDPLVSQVFERAHLADLMAASDYVMLAAPLTPETRGLIGAEQIAAMKPTGVLINVSRGAVVDEAALIDALEKERIGGAALDVFAEEPLPAAHPFYRLKNVLVSPHAADHTRDFMQLAVACFLDNMRRFQAGEPLLNLVDKQAGY